MAQAVVAHIEPQAAQEHPVKAMQGEQILRSQHQVVVAVAQVQPGQTLWQLMQRQKAMVAMGARVLARPLPDRVSSTRVAGVAGCSQQHPRRCRESEQQAAVMVVDTRHPVQAQMDKQEHQTQAVVEAVRTSVEVPLS